LAKQPDKQQIAFIEQFKLQDFQIKKLHAEKDKLTEAIKALKQQVAKLTAENEQLRFHVESGTKPEDAAKQSAAPQAPAPAQPAAPPEPSPQGVNGEQAVGTLATWMKGRSPLENQRVIWFTNVDKELGLPAGASRAYLPTAAESCGYKVLRKSAGTILLQQV